MVQIKHAYDRVGNRLYREDIAATNAGKSFDELYTYDGMNQLKDMQRGKLNSSKNAIASGKNFAEQFTFDATGNFANYKQDVAGDGTFELNQNRTHTKANEIATIAGASTHVSSDRNGNMTKCVKPDNWNASFNLVYDAWNRLVIVKDGSTTVATYFYDGLNHRIKKVVGTETRELYYNRNWQCVAEYIGTVCHIIYVWGLRYVDDLVFEQWGGVPRYALQDANWNVVAFVNSGTNTVEERLTYSAFSKSNSFDAMFNAKSPTANWTRTFTGQVRDTETGLMLYRNRVYHPTLGRFIQRDPIGYDGGDGNIYRYVMNQPSYYVDPYGLQTRHPGFKPSDKIYEFPHITEKEVINIYETNIWPDSDGDYPGPGLPKGSPSTYDPTPPGTPLCINITAAQCETIFDAAKDAANMALGMCLASAKNIPDKRIAAIRAAACGISYLAALYAANLAKEECLEMANS